MYGCEVGPNGRFLHGHWQIGYDGADLISFNETLSSWTAANAEAQTTKDKWEVARVPGPYKAYLQGKCVDNLNKFLKNGTAKHRCEWGHLLHLLYSPPTHIPPPQRGEENGSQCRKNTTLALTGNVHILCQRAILSAPPSHGPVPHVSQDSHATQTLQSPKRKQY